MIIGHKKTTDILSRIIEREKVAQAYIFSGPESVGKLVIAKKFSKSLIREDEFDASKEDADGLVPDLAVIEPEIEEKRGVVKEKAIPIGRIREAMHDLSLFPYSGKYKILIIDNAQKMTENSQNALLKNLEEPNRTSIIILVTHDDGKILPTIKSRCQKINFNLVSPEEIGKGMDVSEEIVKLSLGRPGIAIRISRSKEELDLQTDAVGKLKSLPKSGINKRMKIAEDLSKDTTQAVKTLELWIWILHGSALENTKIFKIIEKIEKSIDEIRSTNANARLILENLLLNL